MKNRASGKYLYSYYKNKLDSFFEHLDKAKLFPDEKNIHNLRVDIKRIRTVFHLIEMIFPKKLKAKNHYDAFKKIFRRAGEVRELQMNYICFLHYKLPHSVNKEYRLFLKHKEKKIKKKLKHSINRFEIALLEKSTIKIKKLCRAISEKRIRIECKIFIRGVIHKIEMLLALGNNYSIVHKIRIHLKAIEAVGDLYYQMNPKKELKKSLTLIKQNGTLLGNWHDKVILLNSLEHFFTDTVYSKGNKLFLIKELLNKINKENQLFLKSFRGKLNSLLKFVKGII